MKTENPSPECPSTTSGPSPARETLNRGPGGRPMSNESMNNEQYQLKSIANKQSKNQTMKTKMRLLQWILVLVFAAGSMGVMAQQPYPNTGDQTVCQDSVVPYGVEPTAGSTYNWQITPGSGWIMTPGATPNLITVQWTTPGTYTLSVTETNQYNCVGTPVTQQITVNPLPLAVATPASQTVCSDVAINTIVLTTSNGVPGTTFAWTRDNMANVTGIAQNGTGDIAGTLTNLTGISQTVTFTIIPTSGAGCEGPSITATVTVDPEPVAVAAPLAQNVCSDVLINPIVLSTSNGLAGTTFAWTRDNTGTITGSIGANGTGNISGTLTNLTGAPVTVTFTITPTSAGGCVGDPITATVTVDPEPIAVAAPLAQNVCSDVLINPIVLSTSNGLAGTTFAWTRDNTGTVTGSIGASGSGNITGTLTNLTGAPVTVTFTITPTSAGGCVGDPITATVTVDAEPVAVAAPLAQNVCSDILINPIVLSTSNGLAGTTFAWTRDNTGTVTGSIGANGTGNISGTLTNLTGAPVTVTFTITPTSAGGCVGDPITATVTVDAEPVAVAAPLAQNVCSDVLINPIVLSTSNGLAGTTFAWTRDNTGTVTGSIGANGTGNISGTLTNLTGAPVTVTFTITPTSAGGCVGDPITATVTVDAEPVAVAAPLAQNVCSDVLINPIVLSTSNGLAGTTFAWTRDNTGTVTGSIGANGTGNISGTLTNLTGAPVTVTFTITPTSAGGCVGDPITATVTVDPEPVALAAPVAQNVCSDVLINPIVLSTSNGLAGTTYAWTRDNTGTVTGSIGASGTGNISGTLTNLTGAPVTVTFTITPTSAGGCVGDPITVTVTVDPEPIAVATPALQTVCSGTAITTIVLSTSNGMSGTTYTWTRDNTVLVTGMPASGSGDISGTLVNTTNVPQTVVFTIIPTSVGGCVGDPITATVIVNPTPITSPIYHN